MTQAADATLQHAFGNQFVTTSVTDPNIYFNIMNYESTIINGKRSGNLWKVMPNERITSGQIEFMINQIEIQKSGIRFDQYYFGQDAQPGTPVKNTGN